MKILFPLVFVLLLMSCIKNEEKTSLVGSWQVEHLTSDNDFKSYQAIITRSAEFDSMYVISNFHDFGIDYENQVYFSINDKGELILANYFVQGGFIVNGKGIVADDFSQIDWNYTIGNVSVEARYN